MHIYIAYRVFVYAIPYIYIYILVCIHVHTRVYTCHNTHIFHSYIYAQTHLYTKHIHVGSRETCDKKQPNFPQTNIEEKGHILNRLDGHGKSICAR